jgi:hypothetical protein
MVGCREQAVSIYAAAFREAERYKWIESEKRGFDAGHGAVREWYRIHWPGFCRRRRLEHLQGRRCWEEFGDDHFGQWHTHFGDDDLLVDRILDRFFAGMENLELINWAYDWGLPVERVVDILTRLDMNRARLEPKTV